MLKEILCILHFQTSGIFALAWRNQIRLLGEIWIRSLRRGEIQISGEEERLKHFR